jgi:hypothetical protein
MIRTAERGPVARRYLSDPAFDKSSIWSRHWCKEPGRGAISLISFPRSRTADLHPVARVTCEAA